MTSGVHSQSFQIRPYYSILHSLHWLPVAARIQYKVSSLCYSSLSDSGPVYLSSVLRIYTPSRQLRSSSDSRILSVPSVKTKTFGQRSFSYAGPVIWNKFPYDTRSSRPKTSFKQALKPHHFIRFSFCLLHLLQVEYPGLAISSVPPSLPSAIFVALITVVGCLRMLCCRRCCCPVLRSAIVKRFEPKRNGAL